MGWASALSLGAWRGNPVLSPAARAGLDRHAAARLAMTGTGGL